MMQEETQRMDAKTGSPEASDEEVEEEITESLKDIARRCDGLARVIVPIIRSLYRGPGQE